GPGPRSGVRDPDHQRPEDLRPGAGHRPWLLTGRRQRDRPADVADGVRWAEQPGAGERAGGVPDRAGDPGHAVQHPSLPEGVLMATATADRAGAGGLAPGSVG